MFAKRKKIIIKKKKKKMRRNIPLKMNLIKRTFLVIDSFRNGFILLL